METKNKDDKTEQRRAQRVYASFVEYCRVEDKSLKKFQAFTENISVSGICIFVNEEIKTNSLLFITIYLLDGSSPIETKGKVVWTRPSIFLHIKDEKHFDTGITFVQIDKKDQDRLFYYTTKHINEMPPSKR